MNEEPDLRHTLALLERAALVAIAGLSVGALSGLLLGLRLGRRWG